MIKDYRRTSNISRTKSHTVNVSRFVLHLFCAMYWSQVLSQEWRCCWSSADMVSPLPWASVHCLVQCTLECNWNTTGWPSVHWDGIPLGDPVNSAGYTGTPLKKLSWNCPTLECHWRDSDWRNNTGGTVTATTLSLPPPHTPTPPTPTPPSPPPSRDIGGIPSSKQTGLCKFSFTYCSTMDISSALQTCEYCNITLYMPWKWGPLQILCIWGCSSNEISLGQTTLAI